MSGITFAQYIAPVALLFPHETLGLVFLAFPSIEMSGRKFFVGELQRPPSSHGLQSVWQTQAC